MKTKFKDLISVLQKYDPELDIHVREDWSYYKESGVSYCEPVVTKYARTEYNTLLTEDEGDLIPLDMLDDVIVDAVAALCEKQGIEYHSRHMPTKSRAKNKMKSKKWFAIPLSTFTYLVDKTQFCSNFQQLLRVTISQQW